MGLCSRGCIAAALLAAPMTSLAVTCTTQAELQTQDRAALAAVGQRLTNAIVQQDYATLQSELLPAISAQWDGMRGEVELGAPLVKGGAAQLQSVYLLDATTQTETTDDQFFCSNASGSLTVTITMHALPPGKYAVILAQATGAPLGGQIGLIVVWDPTATPPAWKLGGVSVRQGNIEGHDGVWYWTRARAEAATGQPWSAWFSYDLARYLLLPVDFLSSPNMEKLGHEQSEIKDPPGGFPISISDGPRTWRVDGVRIDTTLRQADLSVAYESLGMTDPAAERTEATAVLSAMLKAHPELKDNFHGMWAIASKDGKLTPVMELPMGQIP